MKKINLYILLFFVIFFSCQKREPNIYIFDDDLFDVSIDLPFNWKLIDGDHDDFCIVGWCKKDSLTNNYLNVSFDNSRVNKGEKPDAYNWMVETPFLNREGEILITVKSYLKNENHFFMQATTLKSDNNQYLYIIGRTVIYNKISIKLYYWIEVNESSDFDELLKEVEHSISSVKAINIKSSRGFLHHWS